MKTKSLARRVLESLNKLSINEDEKAWYTLSNKDDILAVTSGPFNTKEEAKENKSSGEIIWFGRVTTNGEPIDYTEQEEDISYDAGINNDPINGMLG